MLNCAAVVQPSLGRNIGIMGLFWGFKEAEINGLFVNFDLRLPPVSLPGHSQKTTGIVTERAANILFVRARRCISKVTPSVVSGLAVDVVDVFSGPRPSHKKKRKAMDGEHLSPKINSRIALAVQRTRTLARANFAAGPFYPLKCAGLGVIGQIFPQRGYKTIRVFSHSVSPHVRGQGRALHKQRFRPAFSSTAARFGQ